MNLRFKFTVQAINSWTKRLLAEIKTNYQRIFTKSIPGIKDKWKGLISEAIKNCPEYKSLVDSGGELRAELGVTNAEAVLDSVINEVINSIQIIPKPFSSSSNKIVGGYIIKSDLDYSQILSVDGASYTSYSKKNGGTTVEWLKYLLLQGLDFFPEDYRVVFKASPASRTGLAVMVEGGSYIIGKSSSRVPSKFSGTVDNNFITRALNPVIKTMEQIILKELKSNV